MTAALLLRHPNRTGLRYLSPGHARRQHPSDTGLIHCPDRSPVPSRLRPLQRRRSTDRTSPRTPATTTTLTRTRHDLQPAGPRRGVCTSCCVVFDLCAYTEAGRRLPACNGPSSRAQQRPRTAVPVGARPYGEPISGGGKQR